MDIKPWDQHYDVIVVGGGVSGCCAAIASGRQGARTLLVEKLPFCGGNMTGGLPWLGFHAKDTGEQIVGGIPMEIINRLQAMGGATEFVADPVTSSAVGVNGNMLKLLLTSMLKEANVEVLLHSLVIGVSKKGERVTGVVIANKQGCQRIASKVMIDCTDSADAAALAGAEYTLGRQSDSKRQISSNVIIYGDINFAEMLEYFEERPDQIRPFPLSEQTLKDLLRQMRTAPIFVLGAFSEIIARAKVEGVQYQRDQLIGVAYSKQSELMLVANRVSNVDLNDIHNHSQAELDGLDQTWGILDLLRKYIPGCSRARIVSSGVQLGIRESRHVQGDYLLTASDLMAGKYFEDSICKGGYHMDVHSPDHTGLETRQPPVYTVPYRSLLVKGIEGLLVAGRGISATHEAMSSTRVAPICSAQGQAAGTAAAMAAMEDISPRKLSVSLLKQILLADGAIL